MRTRVLGRTGLSVSEVGFGAWAIGGSMWGGARDDDARTALARAVEKGVTLFDTALVYGGGHSERLVGELVRARPGAGLVVATKVPPKLMRWPPPRDATVENAFPPDWIRSSCEQSLRNLGLDHIDLLQLHVWNDSWTDDDGWYGALVRLRDEGKVRFFGVSINSHEPATALRLVRSGRVDTLQVIHNVFEQTPEDELFPACLEHGVGVLARVPLDEGSLTGKLRPDTTFPAGDFRNSYFAGELLHETIRRVEALRPLLEPSLVRAALRFCLSHPAISTVIPGMRSPAQVDDDCAASDEGPLPPEMLAQLRPHRWDRTPGN